MSKSKVIPGAVTETYTLPSKGKLYGEGFPEEVTIRSMTTFEEKMRLGNQGFWKTMCNIIDAVVTSPEDFDTSRLTMFDFYFMMYKMRTVSYGNIYKVTVTCPTCGKKTVCKVDLDKLAIGYLEDENPTFEIGPLPRTKDVLTCRHLTVQDTMNIEKRAKAIRDKSPDYVGDPSYILTPAYEIVAINGEEPKTDKEVYIERLPAIDSAYFRQAYAKKTLGLGLLTECEDVCPDCGEKLVFELPFNAEFFRPTFDF